MANFTFTYEDDEGNEIVAYLPAEYIVCPECRGEGSHCNRNIDGNGITASDWDQWDLEERESYFSGHYDVPCTECDGKRVILVCDMDLLEKQDPELLKEYENHLRFLHEERRESRYQQRMGF